MKKLISYLCVFVLIFSVFTISGCKKDGGKSSLTPITAEETIVLKDAITDFNTYSEQNDGSFTITETSESITKVNGVRIEDNDASSFSKVSFNALTKELYMLSNMNIMGDINDIAIYFVTSSQADSLDLLLSQNGSKANKQTLSILSLSLSNKYYDNITDLLVVAFGFDFDFLSNATDVGVIGEHIMGKYMDYFSKSLQQMVGSNTITGGEVKNGTISADAENQNYTFKFLKTGTTVYYSQGVKVSVTLDLEFKLVIENGKLVKFETGCVMTQKMTGAKVVTVATAVDNITYTYDSSSMIGQDEINAWPTAEPIV